MNPFTQRRIYEHWRDWNWRNWCGDCQKVKRCGLSGENGKFERASVNVAGALPFEESGAP